MSKTVEEIFGSIKLRVGAVVDSLQDGFQFFKDMPTILRSMADVIENIPAWLETLPELISSDVVLQLIQSIDKHYPFAKPLAEKFVAWDIPWAPDPLVDRYLNVSRVEKIIWAGIRHGLTELIPEKVLPA